MRPGQVARLRLARGVLQTLRVRGAQPSGTTTNRPGLASVRRTLGDRQDCPRTPTLPIVTGAARKSRGPRRLSLRSAVITVRRGAPPWCLAAKRLLPKNCSPNRKDSARVSASQMVVEERTSSRYAAAHLDNPASSPALRCSSETCNRRTMPGENPDCEGS